MRTGQGKPAHFIKKYLDKFHSICYKPLTSTVYLVLTQATWYN